MKADFLKNVGSFSLSWSGGMQYGSRQISFDGNGKYRFAIGDTIDYESRTGVGAFEIDLRNSDLESAKKVAVALCDVRAQSGGPETYDPPATFNVICHENGKATLKTGSLRLIPDSLRKIMYDDSFGLADRAFSEGRKLLKLDFTAVGVEREGNYFVVSVKFINSGERWIKFKTPDQWPSDSIGGLLGVGPIERVMKNGAIETGAESFGFALSGRRLINANEFPDGFVVLNPGEWKILKFETLPERKGVKGEYIFSGIAFMDIEYEGWDSGLGISSHVDFKPIRSRLFIDHDYPSTPTEREQWEKTHRESMSQWPVNPGATFVEDGLYRAIRTSGGYRGLLLKPFKAGDVATTDAVTMPMDSRYPDDYIQGAVQWLWEASAPTPVKQWSLDLIDGTQHHCEPGAACPRSGRWVPRVSSDAWPESREYEYRPTGIVTLRLGDVMPPIRGMHATWEWIGSAA